MNAQAPIMLNSIEEGDIAPFPMDKQIMRDLVKILGLVIEVLVSSLLLEYDQALVKH
jgi:hypothetical protein